MRRDARRRFAVDEAFFAPRGDVILVDVAATRRLAAALMQGRAQGDTTAPILAGELGALGLLHEIQHHVIATYQQLVAPQAMEEALGSAQTHLGRATVDLVLATFAAEYPPAAVHRGVTDGASWLDGTTDGVPNRLVALEEVLLLPLENDNPAAGHLRELFDDRDLARATAYTSLVSHVTAVFDRLPPFGPDALPLLRLLRAPIVAHPESLSAQLGYVRDRWGDVLGELMSRLLAGIGALAEEQAARDRAWILAQGGGFYDAGAADPRALAEWGQDPEPERFSRDLDWMPRLVLVAKSTYVWLDQLSKQHRRAITRLDEVPDAELDCLAERGFTGLWLIGLWERSIASAKIKQMMGDGEAVASAYSLREYDIAQDLGGPQAFANLRDRAWRRGIRLASDMVPNHMGIDSRWLVEHPDWFIQVAEPPYPAYRFTGMDLSNDPRVSVQIEDHYWDKTDAAVVFKRVDKWTGDTRYLYHGNDGTSMPWNDTAQLDYLKPEVREALIQTILHVARQFPIIRFDAAMTLAKRHFSRLWYPEPGSGGGIPSRSEHAMTKAQFDAAVPREFWREVVDRVAAEAPDTLLLAEAFWLMEGYFVRTLGMHRVYNSAFMNMMRDEDNAKYRTVIKNTLEFDREVLKRYVNFMNNPDERTAIDQFGKGDKYFGVATLMSTMPGLPMYGHGQVDGFSEKYGMEFRRPRWDEVPDDGLVAEHRRRLAPLLHRRRIFADVEEFLLYDLFCEDGTVNEDVFAYSNRVDGQRSLVLFHNRYGHASGWIRTSAAYAVKHGGPDSEDRHLAQRSLGDGLGLREDPCAFVAYRDLVTGLEHLSSEAALCEHGMPVELGAYGCRVLVDWRELWDAEGTRWARLAARLCDRGVPSLDEALYLLRLEPLHEALRGLLNAWVVERLGAPLAPDLDLAGRVRRVAEALHESLGLSVDARSLGEAIIEAAWLLAMPLGDTTRTPTEDLPEGAASARPAADQDASTAAPPPALPSLRATATRFAAAVTTRIAQANPAAQFEALRLEGPIWALAREAGTPDPWLGAEVGAARALGVALAVLERTPLLRGGAQALLLAWLDDAACARRLGVNTHEGVGWLSREALSELVVHLPAMEALAAQRRAEATGSEEEAEDLAAEMLRAGAEAGWRVEALRAWCVGAPAIPAAHT